MNMIKFPHIEQFRNVIRHVKNHTAYVGQDKNGDPIYDISKPLPILKFRGTVKLHGSNAAVVVNLSEDDVNVHFQSRSRVLSLTSDNAGFMLAMSKHKDLFVEIANNVLYGEEYNKEAGCFVAIYGEWCGGSIQKGVALNQLEKMFVIFAIKIEAESDKEIISKWIDIADYNFTHTDARIYSIQDFETYEIDIDFSRPELAQNKMIEMTEVVEAECPVGKAFGVSGIGEGIVFACISPGWNDSGTWFKSKGEKHANSKVKTLNPIDVEAVANLHEFVDSAVTENRLEQGLDNLVREQQMPFEMGSMGGFLRWMYNDILREEQDTIIENQIDPKKLGSAIANKARPWYVQKYNESVMV